MRLRRLLPLAASAVLGACGGDDAAPPPAGAAAPGRPASVAAPAAPVAEYVPPVVGPKGIRGVDFHAVRHGTGRDTLRVAKAGRAGKPSGAAHAGWVLRRVTFGDVTGDGEQDAVVRVDDAAGGSSAPARVFVYTVQGGRLAQLWQFTAGDRAIGGLKDARPERGLLVVELFGKGNRPGRAANEADESANGLCCPTAFTRTRLRWTGRAFVADAVPEVLPYTTDEG